SASTYVARSPSAQYTITVSQHSVQYPEAASPIDHVHGGLKEHHFQFECRTWRCAQRADLSEQSKTERGRRICPSAGASSLAPQLGLFVTTQPFDQPVRADPTLFSPKNRQ